MNMDNIAGSVSFSPETTSLDSLDRCYGQFGIEAKTTMDQCNITNRSFIIKTILLSLLITGLMVFTHHRSIDTIFKFSVYNIVNKILLYGTIGFTIFSSLIVTYHIL